MPRDPRESRDPERRQRYFDQDDEKRIREKLATVDSSKTKKLQELEDDFERQEIEDDLLMEETSDEIRSRIARMEPPDNRRPKRLKNTFLNENDPDPWEDDDNTLDDHDDISTLGHGELERHREMRHYARLAAWEMPLLSKLVKPFQPPTTAEPLRFRYTTYMGEQHPAEKKVVLEFSPQDMPGLTNLQMDKLRKLAGVRYNPEKDVIKMASESFETQAQNKRYLGDLVEKLLIEARDPTDTFEDIPLDTRHHHFKTRPNFPKGWIMTEKRQEELALYRQAAAAKDRQKEKIGQLVDGVRHIEEGHVSKAKEEAAVPIMAMLGKRSGKMVGLRRS